MSKKILTILAAVLLVGVTVPAFAAVQNVKVGGDITIRGIYRSNLDFLKDSSSTRGVSNKDTTGWLMTTTRVYVSSELTDNVAAVIRLVNERDWADNRAAGATNDQIDLDLAYIKLSDMFAPGLSATLGRQEILLGEGFVVGNSNPLASPENLFAWDYNSRKSFDAIRLDYEVATVPLILTGVVSKINEDYADDTDNDVGNDVDLYVVNANYQVPTAEAEVEGYFIARDEKRASKDTANPNDQTFGLRAAHNVAAVPGFSWKGEFAKQWGKTLGNTNKGYAGYVGAEYAFQDITWEPKVGLTYALYTGDDDAADTSNDAWISLYPDGLADRIGAIAYASGQHRSGAITDTNLQVVKLIGSIQPVEKVGLSLAWFNLQRAKATKLRRDTYKKNLGNEIDLGINYAYSEDVAMGLLLGYLIPGKGLKQETEGAADPTNSADAIELVATVAVSF